MLLALFAYAFVSNLALAIVPHEPVIIWYGPRLGVWMTAFVATMGTVAAAWVDHRLLAPLIERLTASRPRRAAGGLSHHFARSPFAILALSGLTPLPFFPFKALAFSIGYPRRSYLAAVAIGRLPRYLLLAWLGVTVSAPVWVLALLFLGSMILSFGELLWPHRTAN